MYMYLFGIALTCLFIKLDGCSIISNKYDKWNSLNKLVSTRHKNKMLVIWISIKLICESLYINLIQYLNKSLIKIDKNNYELTYVINGKLYRILVKIKRGPNPILQIISESSEDVTDIISPYIGPQYNWHGNKLTPANLGYKTLIFELSDSTEKIYSESQIISSFDV